MVRVSIGFTYNRANFNETGEVLFSIHNFVEILLSTKFTKEFFKNLIGRYSYYQFFFLVSLKFSRNYLEILLNSGMSHLKFWSFFKIFLKFFSNFITFFMAVLENYHNLKFLQVLLYIVIMKTFLKRLWSFIEILVKILIVLLLNFSLIYVEFHKYFNILKIFQKFL